MDINKYLGKFLFKNKYCSLPGFGTLNLNVVGAKNNLAAVEPGNFNIQFSPVGSIDDKFANYIATNENISLNKASNVISTYCADIKEALQIGSSFEVTGLGYFKNDSNGKVTFKQDEDINITTFQYASAAEMAENENNFQTRQPEEVSFSHQPKKKSYNLNLSKILIPIAVLGVLGVGGYFAYRYLQNNPVDKTEQTTDKTDSLAFNNVPVTTDSNATVGDTNTTNTAIVSDSLHKDSTAVVATPTASASDLKIAILTYTSKAMAEEKSKKLTSYGNNTSVVQGDSTTYYVAITVNSNGRASNVVVDSLRKFFNPSEKMGKVFLLK